MSPRGPQGPAELGSFSQPQGPYPAGTQQCLRCGNAQITRIRMRTPSGLDAVFVSCQRCEQTGWFAIDGDGTPLSPQAVAGQS